MNTLQAKPWMTNVLVAAGVYNLAWSAFAICFPQSSLQIIGLDSASSHPLWQGMGMVIGVFGIGYLLAARDPYRHWLVIFMGLLSKVLSPLGFAIGLANGTMPAAMGWALIPNDLIWWIPFAVILYAALRYSQAIGTVYLIDDFDDPIRDLKTSVGKSVWDLSFTRPQLVVFLRHTGCTFCREALSDLERQRPEIEQAGCGIVLVHPSSQKCGDDMIEKYHLDDLPHLSDIQCRLYRQFGLEHAAFTQLFGLKVMLRGFVAAVLHGHGFGKLQGNAFQMPGAFLVHRGQFLRGYQHSQACDRVNYARFVRDAQTQPVQEPIAV